MKKRRLLLYSLILSLIFQLASCFAITVNAKADGADKIDITPHPAAPYYGRYALSTLENSTALIYAYDKLTSGIENFDETITVYNGLNPLKVSELEVVFDAYRRDHVDHFWLGTSYSYSYTPISVTTVTPKYIFEKDEKASRKAAFENAASDILKLINSEMSDFEKEEILHDALASRVSYVEGENAHNAYGALVEGKAVCEGYAEALGYLFSCAGLETFIALGTSINPTNGSTENHAWNYVKIDGSFYHVDLTWNDQGLKLYKAYFNMTDSAISEDHAISASLYPLPTCNSSENNYFVKYGGSFSDGEYTVKNISDRLKSNGMKTSVYINGSVDGFIEWYYSNIIEIASSSGINGLFSYSYSKLGREIMLEIISCPHTALTEIKAKTPECETNGNIKYYICECGKYFSDPLAKSEITDEKSIILFATGHNFSEKIFTQDYLKKKADSCLYKDEYWFACKICKKSAGGVIGSNSYVHYGDNGAHSLSSAPIGSGGFHAYECTEEKCDYTEEKEECFGGTPLCEEAAKCEICGSYYGEPSGHKTDSDRILSDAIYHWNPCKECDNCKDNKEPHTDSDKNAVCDVCSYKYGESLGSIFDSLGLGGDNLKYVIIAISVIAVVIIVSVISKKKK